LRISPFSFQFFRERERRRRRMRDAEEVLDGMLFASLSPTPSDAAFNTGSQTEAPWTGGDDAVK
jgi:hypothetical protein